MEKTSICKDCKEELYKNLRKNISQVIDDSNATWEIIIDTLGDLYIQTYNCADETETLKYANQTVNCIIENTIKKRKCKT